MSMETKEYLVEQCGPDLLEYYEHQTKNEDCSFYRHRDFTFNNARKIMEKLWAYFHETENYPEYYIGLAKRIAICKCPESGEEKWYNGERCLKIANPVKGSTVTVEIQIKDNVHTRDFIFMGWVKVPVHEWRMTKGTILMLEQSIINVLLPEDKRYLKINR